MPTHLQDTTTLHNGVKMPWLGLGVYKVQEGEEVVSSVKAAIRNGYRSIDTAAVYGNEEGVGQAIRESIAELGIKREDLFVTSKLWNADQGFDTALQAYEVSLKKLGFDYLDLYLIHWPVKGKYKESWKALESIYKDGKVRAIGVSNFHIHHLDDVMQDAELKPVVNQIEFHPLLLQKELLDYCKRAEIQLEAWSPLAQGQIIDNELLRGIAAKYGKSVAQIVLRWDLQHGVVTIPKSIKEQRIVENADVFDFELSDDDMSAIDALNENRRIGPDPDNFNF